MGLRAGVNISSGTSAIGSLSTPSADLGTLFGFSLLSQGVASIGKGFIDAAAITAQSEFEQQQLEFNADLADFKAEDAIRRGTQEAGKIRRQTRRVVGSQRANLAAQGLDIGFGSAAAIQEDARLVGQLDAMTIKNNAAREAFGFKLAASQARSRAKFSEISAKFRSQSSILTGGINAVSSGIQGLALMNSGLGQTRRI